MDIASLWRFDLTAGHSQHPSKGACVLDAVSWFEYGRLGDYPPCVSPAIAGYVRVLNDGLPDDERQRLKAYIPRLAGSADRATEAARADYLAWHAIRVFLPIGLERVDMHAQADALTRLVSFREAARTCSGAQVTARELAKEDAERRSKARSSNEDLTELIAEVMPTFLFNPYRLARLWNATHDALAYAAAAAKARKPEIRATHAMSVGAELINTHLSLLIRWRVIDAAFAALDGALTLGRQVDAMSDMLKLQDAVKAFARAREMAPVR